MTIQDRMSMLPRHRQEDDMSLLSVERELKEIPGSISLKEERMYQGETRQRNPVPEEKPDLEKVAGWICGTMHLPHPTVDDAGGSLIYARRRSFGFSHVHGGCSYWGFMELSP